MPLTPIIRVIGRAVPVAGEDIDTDRIIPARFLKCVTFDGLGANLFRDVRFGADGSKLGHPLDDPRYAGATIMVSGRNFGCGSSREHAPQAIAKAGFKAVVAESFAEIFFGNATALGVPCVSLGRPDLDELRSLVEKSPDLPVVIDLEAQTVRAGDGRPLALSIKPTARDAFIHGLFDPIGQLIDARPDVKRLAQTLPYLRFA
jgi:3-isopropylmalate/(R)-2-methylmalate dehydratase small subunit